MPETRGNLAPAIIKNLSTGEEVRCMFNPYEYTLSKQNRYNAAEAKGKNVPKTKFTQGQGQQLKLQLFFDTYSEGTDVQRFTQGLWRMMLTSNDKLKKNNKSEPPQVEFLWGQFAFSAVIVNLSQKFTLFLANGIPVRTTVDITFQQIGDEADYENQNPTSGGGGPAQTYIVQAGERLDLIAAKVYDDPTQWRLIAQENGITHPLRLRQGQPIVIPPLD
jgi:nucleoid-associated protein YgaU